MSQRVGLTKNATHGMSAEDRFLLYVRVGDDCWSWEGPVTTGGYGVVFVNGRKDYAHRYSYELLVGVIPAGTELDHLCRNPNCVRPSHLDAVTHAENIRRAIFPKRPNLRRSHCKHGHAMTGENVYERKDRPGQRQCRACDVGRSRSRRKNTKGQE